MTERKNDHILGWPRVTGLAVTHFYQHIIMISIPPILTLIQADFNVSYTYMGLVLSISRFAGGVLQLPAGIAIDRWGKKRMLLLGFALLLAAVFCSGLAPTLLILILMQMMVGAGDSVFHPATYSMISQGSHQQTLGRSMSIHTMAGFAGTFLALPIIARMGTSLGWRTTLMFLPIPGLLLLLIFALWFSEPVERKPCDKQHRASLLSGPFPTIFFAGLLGGLTMQGLIAFLPTFLHVVHGLSVVEAGDRSGLLLIGVASMFVGGILADRVDRLSLVTVGTLAAAAMVSVLALSSPSNFVLSVILILTGICIYLTTPAYTALISAYSSGDAQGRLFGVSFAGSAIGASLGAFMVGAIADVAGFQIAFMFLATGSLIRSGLVASLRRFNTHATATIDR